MSKAPSERREIKVSTFRGKDIGKRLRLRCPLSGEEQGIFSMQRVRVRDPCQQLLCLACVSSDTLCSPWLRSNACGLETVHAV